MSKVIWFKKTETEYIRKYDGITLTVSREMWDNGNGTDDVLWFPYIDFYDKTIDIRNDKRGYKTKEDAMTICETHFKKLVNPLI